MVAGNVPSGQMPEPSSAAWGERPMDYAAKPPGVKPPGVRQAGRDRVPGLVVMGFIVSLGALVFTALFGPVLIGVTVDEVVPMGVSLVLGMVGVAAVAVAVALSVVSVRFLDRHPDEPGRILAYWAFALSVVCVVAFLVMTLFTVIFILE